MAPEHVVIDRLGAVGDGVAETPTGRIHVAGALPGETAEIARDGERGQALRILEPSAERAEPFCVHYGTCGGCVAQHMAPALYAGWKRDRLVTALRRGGLPDAVEALVDAHGEGRRRMTFHARLVDGTMQVGLMAARSHRLVPIERCPVTSPGLAQAAAAARTLAAELAGMGKPLDVAVTATEAGLDIDLRGSGPVGERRRQNLARIAGTLDLARLSLHGDLVVARRPPTLAMGRATVLPPPGAFLQATAAGEMSIAEAVLEATGGCRRIVDLFAGTGPLSLRLAERAQVHAVELDAAMLAALARAARETSGLRGVATEARDLFRRPLLAPELERFDAVVLDPPRAGAEAQARQLALAAPSRVVMVSCDPGTFARDAAILVAGGFSLDRALPIDQFKWSTHLEIVGVFGRPPSRRKRSLLAQG